MKQILNNAGHLAKWFTIGIILFMLGMMAVGCTSGKTCMNEKFVGMGHSKWKNHIPKPVNSNDVLLLRIIRKSHGSKKTLVADEL